MTGGPVVITGVGLICPLGDTPLGLHGALCEGRTGFAAPTLFGRGEFSRHRVAEVPEFSPKTYLGDRNLRPLDRTGQLAAVAAAAALADSGWTGDRRKEHELGLILGTMFGSLRTIGEFDRRSLRDGPEYVSPLDFANTVINAAAGQVAIWHQLRGVNSTIAAGAASGLHAIGYAAQLIRTGRAPALVAGGAEEICFESFYGFLKAGLLREPDGDAEGRPRPFDARRAGWALGEGAAFLVLEDESYAAARGAHVIGRIDGFGAGYDARQTMDDEEPNALAHAIDRALMQAGVRAASIGAVSASASGSPVVDAREAHAIGEALGARAPAVPVTAIKSMIGEALGASGALQTIAMLESLHAGRLPGIAGFECFGGAGLPSPPGLEFVARAAKPLSASRALVTAVAPEGNCCALVVSAARD